MPRITLTDIVIRSLKPTPGRQMQYWDASLPAFGCRVGQNKKTFNVMLGKQRRLIKIGNYPAMTLADARRAAHDLIGNGVAASITYAAARDLFFARHLDTLKATTAHQQKTLMRRFEFKKSLSAVTMADIQAVLDDMPPGSARTCFNVMRTFLNWCVDHDHLKQSPLKGRSPYKANTRDRLLSDADVKLIWAESYQHSHFGLIVRGLILSGQRLGQIANYDPAWAQGDTIVFPGPIMKSNVPHAIPLTQNLAANLLQAVKPLTNYSAVLNTFRDALPDVAHFTPHDFRRYFSSTMAKLSTPIDITEALLAHTAGSRSPVQRTYDRFDRMEPMRTALQNYENHLATLGLFAENTLRPAPPDPT